MVLPRWLAQTNRRLTNPLLRRIPARISPFAVVHHTGRKTGRNHSALLVAFRTPSGFVLTPTYGPDADWVRNLLAAGSFTLERRGITSNLDGARLVNRSEAWPHLPAIVRLAMRLLGVQWFVMADKT